MKPTLVLGFFKTTLDHETCFYLAFCGALLGLSAPGIGLWFLAWVAFIPAFLWLQRTTSFQEGFQGGFIFGFVFHALYLSWFTGLHPMTWLGFTPWQSFLVAYGTWGLISLLGAILIGLLFMSYQWLYLKAPLKFLKLHLFLFPLLWVFGFSFYSQLTEIYVPWALLEYTQASIPLMRTLTSTFGSGTIAGLIVFHNTALTELLQQHITKQKESSSDLYQSLVSLTAIPFLLFLSVITTGPENASNKPFPFPVAIIQGNLPIEVIRSQTQAQLASQTTYIQPLLKASFPENTLVVLPEEGIVPDWVDETHPLSNPSVKALQAIASKNQWRLALGVSSFKKASSKTKTTHHYNSLLFLQPTEAPVFYNKSVLVPFGEVTPRLHGLLPEQWMEHLLEAFGRHYTNVFDSGQKPSQPIILKNPHQSDTTITGLICFELAYPSQITSNPGDILINTSNLGWFHQHPFLEAQFLAMGQLRAAQAQRPLIIATNTGVSALINAQGYILQKSPSGQPAQLFAP